MIVRDAMIKDFHCASPGDSVANIAQAMKRHNVGAIPICESNRLIGIITDRDIAIECVASGQNPEKCTVKDFMTADPLYVTPDMDLKQAADLMGQEQVRRLPVVENGRLVGMVSIGDLAFDLESDSEVAELLRRVSVPVRKPREAAASAGSGF